MKNIIILLLAFVCFKSFAATNVDVISAEFGIEDQAQRKTLCLTIVRVPKTAEIIGIVEAIEDCYYARTAKRASNNRLSVNMKDLKPITSGLMSHLIAFDTQPKYFFSEVE